MSTTAPTASTDTVSGLMGEIADIGRDPTRGGYSRPVYSGAEHELREWFVAHAERRGLDVETDRNGIIWAWLDAPHGRREDAIATGSHLDSVPGGGAFDGPLGVASSLVAVDELRRRGTALSRPLVIGVFPEEEGSRFGVACLGSRLLSGAIAPDRARSLTDVDGRSFAEVAGANGLDPEHLGPDEEALGRLRSFVELHVEQGRGLIDLDQPVAIGASVLGHGRWRVSLYGQGNHAGTTLMADRHDPMVVAGQLIVAVRDLAARVDGARATVGRITPVPGGTNVIASRVDLWLDVRHPDDLATEALVAGITAAAHEIAAGEGCTAAVVEESATPTTHFDAGLRDELSRILPTAPVLDTGAGHDAGILAARIPTAMLFVRNPSGVSHSEKEHVEDADSEVGADQLATALAELANA